VAPFAAKTRAQIASSSAVVMPGSADDAQLAQFFFGLNRHLHLARRSQ
jgi:hypothetical protein